MDKHYFIELLHKHLEGKTTAEEEQFLVSYYDLFKAEPDVINVMSVDKKSKLKGEIKDRIWQNILEKEQPDKTSISINKWIIRMAAAAILIAVCITSILFLNKPSPKQQPVVSFRNQQKENRVLYLQDGSTVILGAASKLKYPSSFDGLAKREVYLEGEAFFDITHDASKRFIVHTGKLEIAVLGTAFNIKSIPVEDDITVVVSRGRVKVSDEDKTIGLITKGHQVVYDKSTGNAIEKAVNADLKMNWKRQDLLIDDITVAEAAKLLEDRFDVNISFSDDQIKTKRFTTVFLSNESLEQILRSICEFNEASYKYNREKASVTISKN